MVLDSISGGTQFSLETPLWLMHAVTTSKHEFLVPNASFGITMYLQLFSAFPDAIA
jgi:hypothetical protein